MADLMLYMLRRSTDLVRNFGAWRSLTEVLEFLCADGCDYQTLGLGMHGVSMRRWTPFKSLIF
eukprot:2236967-Pyramimonas_sp.AAC.1